MDSLVIIGLLILAIGFILAEVEMLLPGFGVPGISGAICLVIGLVLTSKNLEDGILHTIIVVAILAVMMTVTMLFLHFSRKSSPMVLKDEMKSEAEYINEEDLNYLLDKEGVALTDLRPLGTGMFDGIELNIKSYNGKFIKHNTDIVIVSTKNNMLLVKEK